MMKVKEIRMSELGIQLSVESSSLTGHLQLCSFTMLSMPCQLPEAGKSHIQVRHFQILSFRYLYRIEKNICCTFALSWLQTSIKGHEALLLSSHHLSNPTHSHQWGHVVPECLPGFPSEGALGPGSGCRAVKTVIVFVSSRKLFGDSSALFFLRTFTGTIFNSPNRSLRVSWSSLE